MCVCVYVCVPSNTASAPAVTFGTVPPTFISALAQEDFELADVVAALSKLHIGKYRTLKNLSRKDMSEFLKTSAGACFEVFCHRMLSRAHEACAVSPQCGWCRGADPGRTSCNQGGIQHHDRTYVCAPFVILSDVLWCCLCISDNSLTSVVVVSIWVSKQTIC